MPYMARSCELRDPYEYNGQKRLYFSVIFMMRTVVPLRLVYGRVVASRQHPLCVCCYEFVYFRTLPLVMIGRVDCLRM